MKRVRDTMKTSPTWLLPIATMSYAVALLLLYSFLLAYIMGFIMAVSLLFVFLTWFLVLITLVRADIIGREIGLGIVRYSMDFTCFVIFVSLLRNVGILAFFLGALAAILVDLAGQMLLSENQNWSDEKTGTRMS